MNPKTIIFRADGNSEIGIGHVIRSLALAAMLKDDYKCIFATRFLTDFIEQEALKVCETIIELPKSDAHFGVFLTYLKGDEIVVLDNYFFTTKHQHAIKEKGCKLVCIDDTHATHFVADIVINHAPQAKASDYSASKETNLCLGLNYLLLRPVFLQYAKKTKNTQEIDTIFICFGGSDSNNLTLKTALQLQAFDSIRKVTIVIGSAYQHAKALEKFVFTRNNFEKFKLRKNLPEKEMADAISNSDLAIVPCSSILFECLALKVPVITGYFVENQKEIAAYFQNQNIGHVVGNLNQIQLAESMLKPVSKDTLQYINQLIDGNSDKRLKEVFKCLH